MRPIPHPRITFALRRFLRNEAAGGLILMAMALMALLIANSPFSPAYFGLLNTYLGPLSVHHWINDALMALFFLLVGLEIKREMREGQLASWDKRVLPGAAALGGMLMPALIYLVVNQGQGTTHGWAIPAATDIAFALGVLSLLGSRVPVSLKVFLVALAIMDDLGAVLIIALFYSGNLYVPALAGAAAATALLAALNLKGITRLWPYLAIGAGLWVLVLLSGVHATVAGVILALAIPLTPGTEAKASSPLHRLEHALHKPVAFFIVPLFGFANAGVSFAGFTGGVLLEPVALGVASGLFIGKITGVFGAVALMVGLRLARLPEGSDWRHMFALSMLCGIGFTMSLFIGALAFDDPGLREEAKVGILAGSLLAGLGGYAMFRFFTPAPHSSSSRTPIRDPAQKASRSDS